MHSCSRRRGTMIEKTVFITIFLCVLLETKHVCGQTSTTSTLTEVKKLDEETRKQPRKSFKVPNSLQQDYPYYLAGYDTLNQPVWIIELGKWNLKTVVDGEQEKIKEFDEYIDQMFDKIQKSIFSKSSGKKSVKRWANIIDMKDYDISQLASLQSIVYLFKFAGLWETAANNLDYGFIINTNYESMTLLKGIRSLLGPSMDKVEIFGSNPAMWAKRIQRKIPKHIFPLSYSRFKTFPQLSRLGDKKN